MPVLASKASDHFAARLQPRTASAIYNAESGARLDRSAGIESSLPAGRLRSREVQDRMKKIALVAFLLAVSVAAVRAQESRQDVSLSGIGLIEPPIAAPTDVYVHATPAYGLLASYRFMLTPSSALEGNYGVTYQNRIGFSGPNIINNPLPGAPESLTVLTRNMEMSGAYVRSFNYRKYNPFVEVGAAGMIFMPIRNSGTTDIDARRQTRIGGLYGIGVAYEISPSYDIRVEYRAIVTKVPTFGVVSSTNSSGPNFTTDKWYNIFIPTVGVAYHF